MSRSCTFQLKKTMRARRRLRLKPKVDALFRFLATFLIQSSANRRQSERSKNSDDRTSLAQNLVDRGIRVNCVAPGPVWTPLNVSDKPAEKVSVFGQDTPMRRPAQPEEIAPAFVFFASEADSSYISSEVLALLGGETTAA
jgi:hypothetical protein